MTDLSAMPTTDGAAAFADAKSLDHAPPSALAMMDALMAGLDQVGQGVAILDDAGHLHMANHLASVAFAQAGFLRDHGRLRCMHPDLEIRWGACLHDVCALGRTRLLALPVEGAGVLALSLTPVLVDRRRLAFAAFGRHGLCDPVALTHFARRHSLTRTETRVLERLAQGLKAADIARAHGVAVSTVMTQMASIRAKTGTGSVRRLMETLSRLPPMSGPDGLDGNDPR